MRPRRTILSAPLGLCLGALSFACSEVYGTPIVDSVPGEGGSGEPVACPSSLVGFASVGALTGGSAGKTVRADSADELEAYASDPAPLVIEIATAITLNEAIRPAPDKTLLGVGSGGALLGAGLYLKEVHNVIVRNLSISMVPKSVGDAIGVQSSERVWLDHCEFFSDPSAPKDTYDGLVDITHGSDYVTVSWSYFHDHYNAMLIGHSEAAADEDVGHLTVTLHHNWFQQLRGYASRARFGRVHLFNNFYRDLDATAVISESDAELYLEGNVFDGVPAPLVTHYADALDGKAAAIDNDYKDSGASAIGAPATWLPSSAYAYSADSPAFVPSLVERCAGVGHL